MKIHSIEELDISAFGYTHNNCELDEVIVGLALHMKCVSSALSFNTASMCLKCQHTVVQLRFAFDFMMKRPCCEAVVLFVGCQVENLLLSSSTNSSASAPLSPEHYRLILIQEQPTAKDLQSVSRHLLSRIKHLLCLKDGRIGIACSCF